MDDKYFATVIAADRAALSRLGAYDLDLLHQTAAITERRTARVASSRDKSKPNEHGDVGVAETVRQPTIDALLSLEQVGRLVSDGYQVLVFDKASLRSRASQVMEFQDWLKAIVEE